MKKEPNNSDIMRELGKLGQKVEDVASEGASERAKIYEQARKTNGRVTVLEQVWRDYQTERRIRKELRGESKAENTANIGNVENVNIKKQWFEDEFVRKLIIACGVFLTAAAAFLGATA